MTVYYVSLSGSDTSPYDTWAKASTDIEKIIAMTLVAGDVVRVESIFSQTWLATTTLDWTVDANAKSDPVEVISCNTSDVYARGASLTVTGAGFDLYLYGDGVNYRGMNFTATDDIYLCYAGEYHRYDDCHFDCDDINTPYYGSDVKLMNNCVVTSTSSGTGLCYLVARGVIEFVDVTFVGASLGSLHYMFYSNLSETRMSLKSCDLSGVPVGFICDAATNPYIIVNISRCSLHLNTTKIFKSIPTRTTVRGVWNNCFSGTDSDPAQWIHRLETAQGTVASDDARNRTDGASDGTTSYCWEIVPEGTNNTGAPLRLEPIVKYVSAGSQSVVIYVASGVTLNDDDVWIEVESPSEASPADAQSKWRTTKPAPLVAATALTTDAVSTWIGIGIGTKQKISVTIAPTEAGVVKITPYVATTSTIYIDPVIIVNNNQDIGKVYFVDSMSMNEQQNIFNNRYVVISK